MPSPDLRIGTIVMFAGAMDSTSYSKPMGVSSYIHTSACSHCQTCRRTDLANDRSLQFSKSLNAQDQAYLMDELFRFAGSRGLASELRDLCAQTRVFRYVDVGWYRSHR
jgi:hypothetical protein